MILTLILIIFAGLFAGLAAIRQYVEINKFPVQKTIWENFRKRYLNFTIIFIFLAALCAGLASIRQYLENDKVSKKNDALQSELINFVFGSDESPAVTASVIGDTILFSIGNPDKKYPMYNVRIKCRETFYPDIGTLYPGVNKILQSLDMSQRNEDSWYFIIWYNNTKNLEADVEIKRNANGNLIATTKYLDEKEIEFVPLWKHRVDSLNKIIDTTVVHYHPNQHQ